MSGADFKVWLSLSTVATMLKFFGFRARCISLNFLGAKTAL